MSITPGIRLAFLAFALSLLATGILILAVSIFWLNHPDTVRDAVVTMDLVFAGIVFGVFTSLSTLPGLLGNLSPVRCKRSLIIYVILVVVVIAIDLSLATVVWFRSLQLRSAFAQLWAGIDRPTRISFQGYAFPADNPALTPMCSPSSTLQGKLHLRSPIFQPSLVVSRLITPSSDLSNKIMYCRGKQGCINPITAIASIQLINIYTTLYAFSAIGVLCILSGIVLIYARNDEERFLRIEEKQRGDRALNLQYV
ncbi:hypothetical protein BC937DRAFT_92557 [Endogone sp. FLAS-F59071]|nr:hypothetical protein BC937DRAFT_92557 [Endogone sp. FLAS-F59071]|eukprot:RUS15348.1 hypothetical protein BC937DRAFT_92557 [Endogone sp. FLAS-F59071]